jgi:hypothetical protein
VVAIVVVATIIGAAVGALLSRTSGGSQRAATTLLVNAAWRGDSLDPATRTRRLSDALRGPETIAAAVGDLSLPLTVETVRREVEVRADPRAARIGISAAGRTTPDAIQLTDSLAVHAVAQLTVRPPRAVPGHTVVGDFEGSDDGWEASTASGTAGRLERAIPARYNGSAIKLTCVASERCSAAVPVATAFRRGSRHAVAIWVRATTSAGVDLRFGAPGQHPGTGSASVATAWRRIQAPWTPERTTDQAGIVLSARLPAGHALLLDGVTLNSGASASPNARPLAPEREATMFAARPYAVWSPPSFIGRDPAPTAGWALVGAATGLVIALATSLTAIAARRRRADLVRERKPNGRFGDELADRL